MGNYYTCLINDKRQPITPEEIEDALGDVKDWLRFNQYGYIVYTALSASDIRDRLRSKLGEKNANVLVVKADKSIWAAYADETSRNWMRTDRDDDLDGE